MPTYAFVASLASSPTILLNLDNQSPFSVVAGTQTPPPVRRSSTTSTAARDGDNVSQVSYADRIITIPLRVELRTTAEQQTEGIQKLARLLDGPQWLMWKHDGMIEPVWFRTKYGDMDIVDDILNETPRRTVTLTLVAEPFAYGAAVSGTATIANDPTAATNPMSLSLPSIQGDVAAPLYLSSPGWPGLPGLSGRCLMASTAAASVAGAISRIDITATAAGGATGTYSMSDVVDTLYIGGKRRRVTNSGTTGTQTVWTGSITPRPGDYRVLVSLAASTAATWKLDFAGLSKTITFGLAPRTWVDMGVARLPLSSPMSSPLRTRPTVPSALTLTAATTTAGGSLDFDEILFIPCGLDDAVDTRLATLTSNGVGGFLAGGGSGASIVADGEANVAYDTNALQSRVLSVTGGLLRVVPAYQNLLSFVWTLYRSDTASEDYKATTVVVSWSYYPRYLYIRPATT